MPPVKWVQTWPTVELLYLLSVQATSSCCTDPPLGQQGRPVTPTITRAPGCGSRNSQHLKPLQVGIASHVVSRRDSMVNYISKLWSWLMIMTMIVTKVTIIGKCGGGLLLDLPYDQLVVLPPVLTIINHQFTITSPLLRINSPVSTFMMSTNTHELTVISDKSITTIINQ